MTEKKKKITILGVGNILLADEGFGVHFVRWFSQLYKPAESVSIIDGGTLGYALIDIICSCDNLIVIDVLKVKDAPGSIYRFNTEEMQAHMPPPTTAHEVTFFDVLFKVELMDELPQTLFLCIVPQDYGEMNMEMTSVMKEKFPVMEKLLLDELDRLNVKLERIDTASFSKDNEAARRKLEQVRLGGLRKPQDPSPSSGQAPPTKLAKENDVV